MKFATAEDASQALTKHRHSMGSRYIELFRASPMEVEAINPAGISGSEHVVRLRGLPFVAREHDITEFLSGCQIAQQGIHLVYTQMDRPSGEVCWLGLGRCTSEGAELMGPSHEE